MLKNNVVAAIVMSCLVPALLVSCWRIHVESTRADAAEARVERLVTGQNVAAALLKKRFERERKNCAKLIESCKMETLMALPCYPHCSEEGVK